MMNALKTFLAMTGENPEVKMSEGMLHKTPIKKSKINQSLKGHETKALDTFLSKHSDPKALKVKKLIKTEAMEKDGKDCYK